MRHYRRCILILSERASDFNNTIPRLQILSCLVFAQFECCFVAVFVISGSGTWRWSFPATPSYSITSFAVLLRTRTFPFSRIQIHSRRPGLFPWTKNRYAHQAILAILSNDYCLDLGWYNILYEESRFRFSTNEFLIAWLWRSFCIYRSYYSGQVPCQPL